MGPIAIRRWSEMNPWIDFTVIVQEEDEALAEYAICEAYDLYWDEEFECYGDALYDCLNRRIGEDGYTITFIDDIGDNYDGDNPEYEEWFDGLGIPSMSDEWAGLDEEEE